MAAAIVNVKAGGFPSNVLGANSLTAGNVCVVSYRNNASMGSASISDTIGNTYIKIGDYGNVSLWYCVSVGTNASNVITISDGASGGFQGASSVQISGLDTVYPLVGSALTHDLNPMKQLTWTVENGIFVANGQVNATGATWTAGSSFTKQVEDTSKVQAIATRVIGSGLAGYTLSSPLSCSSGSAIKGVLAFFREPVSGGSGPPSGAGISRARVQRGM